MSGPSENLPCRDDTCAEYPAVRSYLISVGPTCFPLEKNKLVYFLETMATWFLVFQWKKDTERMQHLPFLVLGFFSHMRAPRLRMYLPAATSLFNLALTRFETVQWWSWGSDMYFLSCMCSVIHLSRSTCRFPRPTLFPMSASVSFASSILPRREHVLFLCCHWRTKSRGKKGANH